MNKLIKKVLPKALGAYINLLALVNPKASAKKAFQVFSKPRQGKIGPHHEDFLNPVLQPKIETEGLSIQPYRWEGTGKTILLVHGWESHSHRWKEMVLRLQKEQYNIIAFDAPGHGYSSGEYLYVPLYNNVLNTMLQTYKPHFIIGHSIGAMTVLYNQSQTANYKASKLVILGPPDRLESILFDYKKILTLSDRSLAALDEFFMTHFNFKSAEFSSSAFAKNIRVPTLLVHDKDDKITPVTGSRAIYAALKDSKYIETEGLNHSLYDAEVNEKIIAFLSE